MANYNLQPNEVILLKDESVRHGGGSLANYSDELILTNLNLVLVKKGMFGKSKGIHTYPLNQVKVYNHEAQARIGNTRNGAVLEVYFLNGEEQFAFQNGGKKKVLDWAAKINEAVTGQSASQVVGGPSKALPGTELVAGMLKDTLNAFKSKRGSTSDAPATVAAKCSACGAPVAGRQGQSITCEYCGSAQQL